MLGGRLMTAATPHTARVVLDIVAGGEAGYATGYDRALCRVIFQADQVHRGKLRGVYPEMVDAVEQYEREGAEATRALAGSDRPPG